MCNKRKQPQLQKQNKQQQQKLRVANADSFLEGLNHLSSTKPMSSCMDRVTLSVSFRTFTQSSSLSSSFDLFSAVSFKRRCEACIGCRSLVMIFLQILYCR